MPLVGITGVLPPHLAHEAIRLFFEVIGQLHAVSSNNEGVLFALAASPQLADALAVFGAKYEDDEGDGQAEADERLSPVQADALFAPAPLQGHAVPDWTAPDLGLPKVPGSVVAEFWPDLVRPPADAA